MFGGRIEVVGTLWWLVRDIGQAWVWACSPGRARRALAALGPEGPWGWMLVFGVRIEVVGSLC